MVSFSFWASEQATRADICTPQAYQIADPVDPSTPTDKIVQLPREDEVEEWLNAKLIKNLLYGHTDLF